MIMPYRSYLGGLRVEALWISTIVKVLGSYGLTSRHLNVGNAGPLVKKKTSFGMNDEQLLGG